MDIIFEWLSETMEITRFGVNTKDLLLRHVSFYVAEKPLRKDCVYIVRASELAEQPIRCRGIHFICVGGRAPQALIRGANSFLVLEDQGDILEVFTVVQDAFLYYETWEDKLREIIRTTADIGEMIAKSVPVFNNPLLLIDRD
ncbi:MAG: hypothetical protein LBK67_07450, partial [Coriobacteriales bacterium]|nr:hypothetical protein [Coriobacteriales bacterium]